MDKVQITLLEATVFLLTSPLQKIPHVNNTYMAHSSLWQRWGDKDESSGQKNHIFCLLFSTELRVSKSPHPGHFSDLEQSLRVDNRPKQYPHMCEQGSYVSSLLASLFNFHLDSTQLIRALIRATGNTCVRVCACVCADLFTKACVVHFMKTAYTA